MSNRTNFPFFGTPVTTAVLVTSQYTTINGWAISNPNAAVEFVQVFDANATTSVTLGTTPPKFVIPLTSSGTALLAGLSIGFHNGVVIACTTTATGSTASATGLIISLFFN